MSNAQFILIEPDMPGKKILIVDDSKIILRALSMKLSGCGYEVLTAEDGSSAVRIARHEQPQLILLDVSFPPDVAHGGGVGWDGFLIMDWLRRMDEARSIPVFVISGGDASVYGPRARAAGALHYFQKPIDQEELLGAIEAVLGGSEAP